MSTTTHRVIVGQFVSLDGVTEDPDGSGGTPFGGWAWRYGPEPVAGDKFRMGSMLDTGVMLIGRTTWELFAGIFPNQDDEFSRRLTAMDKLVLTRTALDPSRWANSTAATGDLVDTVAERRRDQDLYVVGSTSVVDELLARDLVDELRLSVFPIVVGAGRRLFGGTTAALPLRLVSSDQVGSGVQLQIFERETARTDGALVSSGGAKAPFAPGR